MAALVNTSGPLLLRLDAVCRVLAGTTMDVLPFLELKKLPVFPGAYVVFSRSTVLYVGQADNLKKRWVGHHRRKQLQGIGLGERLFIGWLKAFQPELRELEINLIRVLQPTLNGKQLPRQGGSMVAESGAAKTLGEAFAVIFGELI